MTGAPEAAAADTRVREVLVVDDNPPTRYATSRVLRAAGFAVREAATGTEALARADASVSAVVLDVHLPDIDGFEVCARLRARAETARVPVVHLSAAHVRDHDKLQGLHAGADVYMTHPAEPALLVATLQALIRARTAEDALRRSEARLRALFDSASSGICVLDADCRLLELNPAFAKLLQRDPGELVGRALREFAPPQSLPHVQACLTRDGHVLWRDEFPLLRADGELVHLDWSVSQLAEPGASMAVVVDVSERVWLVRQREEVLRREQAARAAAERVSRSKDEFIAVLSHELRTPLNAIVNWLHVLKHPRGSAELPRAIEAIERNARAQTLLISDLLDLSRLDLGKLHLEPEIVDLGEVAASAAGALAGPLGDKRLELVQRTDGGPHPVDADPARLQQIVWNLLSNAIKFSAPGGRIELTVDGGGGQVRLGVRDHGQGIRPDFLPFVFDRFSQSDTASTRLHAGLGLGLSIVKRLAELHGGAVTAASDGPGHGACFVVSLPRAASPPPAPGPAAGEAAAPAPPRPAGLGGVDILLVEDDADSREMLAIVLAGQDATVRTAADHDSALARLAERRPDVLISDIGLPGKDGCELARRVRAGEAPGGARLPCIALTAFARAQDRDAALAAGFDAHCAKPLHPNDLVAAILALVRAG